MASKAQLRFLLSTKPSTSQKNVINKKKPKKAQPVVNQEAVLRRAESNTQPQQQKKINPAPPAMKAAILKRLQGGGK